MSLLIQTFIVIQRVCAAAILEYLLESASMPVNTTEAMTEWEFSLYCLKLEA